MPHSSLKRVVLALAVVLSAALPALAADSDAPVEPKTVPAGVFASGVHSPVTHLYEVMNAAVLHDTALDTVHGTLAERANTRPVHEHKVAAAAPAAK